MQNNLDTKFTFGNNLLKSQEMACKVLNEMNSKN